MKSEKAKEYLSRTAMSHNSPLAQDEGFVWGDTSVIEAVELAEQEAEERMQTLRDKFSADIRAVVDRWDESDKKIDRLWIRERDELKREIERYKRDLAEAKERLRIAEKVIEDKNRQPRK